MRPSDNHFEIREILDAIAVAVERGELSQPSECRQTIDKSV